MSLLRRLNESSVVRNELQLTTTFVGGIGSIANDFGFNRRVDIDSATATGGNVKYVDSFFGRVMGGGGQAQYVHPVFNRLKTDRWQAAESADDATRMWGKYFQEASESGGFTGAINKGKLKAFNFFGGETSFINRTLTRAGGLGTLVPVGMAAYGAIGDFKEGYRDGGIVGGTVSAATGYLAWGAIGKGVSWALWNPGKAIAGLGIAAAATYTAYKTFDVKNKGVNYLKMGRMGGLSWNSGSTPGMDSAMAGTIRQRSLMAMENSRFNAMRAIGGESYMMAAPRSRYANSTAIYSQSPMLSY
jgi:hypothetical protein